MDTFPLFWTVKGRTVLLFGSGDEAAAKLRLLQKTSARIVVIAPAFDGLDLGAAEAVVAADPLAVALPAAALAYAATGDHALDAAIAERLRAAGIPVCAADQPAVSDFITPAIVDRDPVVVAIGTEGTAPVLAREIKARIERMLPTRLGGVARKAGALRDQVARIFPAGEARRRFWHGLFGEALEGRFERSGFTEAAERALEAGPLHADGTVAFVGAGAGSADLLTERARNRIDRADVVLFDALVDPAILELARREATMVSVGKRSGRHGLKQAEINALLVEHARSGARVVRLKGGDPSIFGRLAEEIDAVQGAGFPVEIVPGVTAASVAAASALAPLTERGVAQELRILTAHGVNGEDDVEAVDWASAAGTAPLAIYMGRSGAESVAHRLLEAGRHPETPAILVESAGRDDERIARCTLATLAAEVARFGGTGPLMILVGMRSRLGAPSLPSAVLKDVA